LKLRRAEYDSLARGDVGEHLREKVLDELERSDRLAELQPLLRISQRILVSAHLQPGRFPRRAVTRAAKHQRSVAEGHVLLQAIGFGNADVVEGDQSVLDDLEANLAVDLLDAEAGSLVLDDEALDLVVV